MTRVKEESKRAGLKFNMKKTNIMTSSTITSWQTDGEKVEAMTELFFLGSESQRTVTAAMNSEDDCFLAGKQ